MNKTEQNIMQSWRDDNSLPLVSICCITYNHENYIKEAIESFLIQETSFPFEIVIGEDCSSDDTRKIIETYTQNYPNMIRLIASEHNVGMQANFIRTMEACRGEYIALCEGDDYWTDTKKLQFQIEEMQKHSQCHLSFHPTIVINNTTITNDILSRHVKHDEIFTVQEVILGDGGFCPTASLIIKKEAMANLPDFFAHAPAGDYILQIFGSRNGGALYIDKVMSAYRAHLGGVYTSTAGNHALKIKFTFRLTETLQEMDAFFNFRYHEEISVVKNNQILNLSEGISWLETQLQNHQDSLKVMQEAKEWLSGQLQNHQKALEEKEQAIEALQEAKDWLDGQYHLLNAHLLDKDLEIETLQEIKDTLILDLNKKDDYIKTIEDSLNAIKNTKIYKILKKLGLLS